MEEAFLEAKIKKNCVPNPDYALFSHKYINEINELNHKKKYDYCFIGSINSNKNEREWVIKFSKEYFTKNSIYINTDININNFKNYKILGEFDYSSKLFGFNPKNHPNNQSREAQFRKIKENKYYFETMCQSKYILCPAGDSAWSFRFYETLMCNSVPIVKDYHDTYRSKEESKIPYKYILESDIENIDNYPIDNIIILNKNLFKKYHMLNLNN